MRTLYSCLLASWLLCTSVVASAVPVNSHPNGPGKPALVTTLPVTPMATVQPAAANKATAAAPAAKVRKDKSGSKKVWLFVGIGVALALLRILV